MKLSKRHLLKSISWRIIGTIDTFFFAWLITGNFNQGISISAITTFTKLIWYYFHERLWFNSSVKNVNKRHIIKTFSWRAIGTLDTMIFCWIFTGNAFIAFKIGSLETVSKMLLYYFHEKLWYRVKYGLDFQYDKKLIKKSNPKKK